MIGKPMDVMQHFPVRKTKKQKQQFRDAVQSYLKTIGYDSSIEKGSMGARNIVIGSPETAKYLVTAHYDTPANMFLPNLVTPCNLVAYLLYQILVVGLFVAASIGVGILGTLAARNADFGSAVGMLSYWVMLLMIMVGPANRNNSNDNTSGVVTLLEIARSLPEGYRDQVCFVLFDLEEAGLVGSSSYQKAHKKHTVNQLVLNMDCVGDGNEIVMFPTKKLKKDADKRNDLRRICGVWGEKSIALQDTGFSFYPSDQANFPYGVGIGAFHRSKWAGLYYSRIHTKKDTVLEETNVNILRAAIVSLITCSAVK